MSFLTDRLARHALDIDVKRLPDKVSEMTLCCILDLLTAAIAGVGSTAPAAALSVSERLYGPGCAPAWFTGHTSSLMSALLHNALAASALDLDDGSRSARGHPGASVIPTVLTLASTLAEIGSDDILAAIVAGYDVGVRIAAAQNTGAILTRQTGRWAAFASAAAAGRLLKVAPEHLAEALAIAGVIAPNQRANGSSGYSRMTVNLVKEGIAFSSQLGLQAVFLAQAGFTGPIDLLDYEHFYDANRILDGLGERFEILDTYFKPYACCRYIHPALDAFRALRHDHDIPADDIAEIEVEIFGFALRLANSPDPENLTALQYSLPYCLAVLAILGEDALAPVKTCLLHRPELTALASKIKLSVDPEAEALFPIRTAAKVNVVLKSETRVSSQLTYARGDPSEPMNIDALVAKFRHVTRGSLAQAEGDRLTGSIGLLRQGHATELLHLLEQCMCWND